MDWKLNGQTLMMSMTNVFHKILRRPIPFTPDKESLLEMCLGLFHAPTKPILDEVMPLTFKTVLYGRQASVCLSECHLMFCIGYPFK